MITQSLSVASSAAHGLEEETPATHANKQAGHDRGDQPKQSRSADSLPGCDALHKFVLQLHGRCDELTLRGNMKTVSFMYRCSAHRQFFLEFRQQACELLLLLVCSRQQQLRHLIDGLFESHNIWVKYNAASLHGALVVLVLRVVAFHSS